MKTIAKPLPWNLVNLSMKILKGLEKYSQALAFIEEHSTSFPMVLER